MLVRADGAGGTRAFVDWLTGQGVQYSVGYTLPFITADVYRKIDADAWVPALNADGHPRTGADVTEITQLIDLAGWPAGMRVIVRRELPHPGAQLRFQDVDGYRLTAFATNHSGAHLPRLETQRATKLPTPRVYPQPTLA